MSIKQVLALTGIYLAVILAFTYYLNIPVMQVSQSTSKCVKIDKPYTCANPPVKYRYKVVK